MTPLAPVFIASPVRRSGTTLLQRLLCSADHTLIYGETSANDLQFMCNFFTTRQLYLGASSLIRDQQLQDVLNGAVNHWIPDLMPEIKIYLDALKNNCFSIVQFYKDYAEKNGKTVWGMKMAEWSANQIIFANQLFPESKLLYIFRSLEDCVRSAKTIKVINTHNELQYYCQTWLQNLRHIRQNFPGSKLLLIDYDQLIVEPEPILKAMESFTGARNIDRDVLNHKINSYKTSPGNGANETGYIRPSDLDEEELSIIKTYSEQATSPHHE